MINDIERVLLNEEEIKARVKELAKQIEKDYNGESLTVICILRGASVFFADLVREINLDVRFEFMSVSSYGAGTESSGNVRILQDVVVDLSGKNVLIVEDIIDSGRTLSRLVELLKVRGPKSVKVCALLDKPSRRTVNFNGDYIGFEIPDAFVVGYGLDFDEKYRNLKDIGILKPEIYM